MHYGENNVKSFFDNFNLQTRTQQLKLVNIDTQQIKMSSYDLDHIFVGKESVDRFWLGCFDKEVKNLMKSGYHRYL